MADPQPLFGVVVMQCDDQSPHASHEWVTFDALSQSVVVLCQGKAGPGHRRGQPELSDAWVEVFYVESWVDPQALDDPRFAPRGRALNGPFPTYAQAAEYVPIHRPRATHFQVLKHCARKELVRWFTPSANTDGGMLKEK